MNVETPEQFTKVIRDAAGNPKAQAGIVDGLVELIAKQPDPPAMTALTRRTLAALVQLAQPASAAVVDKAVQLDLVKKAMKQGYDMAWAQGAGRGAPVTVEKMIELAKAIKQDVQIELPPAPNVTVNVPDMNIKLVDHRGEEDE